MAGWRPAVTCALQICDLSFCCGCSSIPRNGCDGESQCGRRHDFIRITDAIVQTEPTTNLETLQLQSHIAKSTLTPTPLYNHKNTVKLHSPTEQSSQPQTPPPNSVPRQGPTTLQPQTLIALILALLAVAATMTSAMPGFIARLTRPFTTATSLGISSAENGAAAIPEGAQKATVAAGCFWGVEHIYRKHFEGKGLYDARVGYIGGDTSNPSYRAVCSGSTGRE